MSLHRLAELGSPPVTIAVPRLFFRVEGAFPWVATVLGVAILISTLLSRLVQE